ncbi:SusD family protein [compost metagenome]
MLAINTLLRSRWDKNLTYTNVAVTNPDVLLPLILQERRKELVFRGRRWSDLKRLNQDRRFQKTLIRKIKGVEYQLLPNSLLYAYRLPEIVIEQAEIPQNKR